MRRRLAQALFHTETSSQDYKIYLIVFLAAISARILFFFHIDETGLFMKYPFFAEKVAAGEDIGTRLTDLSPFYLYFMTFLKKVFNVEWTTVKVIQSFFGVLNSLLLCVLGSRIFSREAGFWAAVIFSLYGNLIILESTLEPTIFILSFNLLCVYCLFRVHEDFDSIRSTGFIIGAGFLAGLSIITKPNSLLLLPVGVIWVIFFADRHATVQKRLKMAVAFCCVAMLVVLPITLRNYVKLDEFVLVTADGGKVFFHGNGQGATALEGTGLPDEGFSEEGRDEPDYAHVAYRKTASLLSGRELSPAESSKFWFRRTLRDIAGDPISYMKLEAKKIVYFFNNYEMHYIASAYKEYVSSLSFPLIRYGLIASLGLLGMILGLRRFPHFFLVYAMVALYLISGMLFLVQSRYRTPAVPYLCLFAGYCVWTLKRLFAEKRHRALGLAVLAAGVLVSLTHFVFKDEIHRVDQWQRATKIHYQAGARPFFKMGRYEEAIAELNQCMAIVPNFSPAYNLRGKSLAILGRNQEALSDFQKVIYLSPNSAEGYKNAGFLYLLQNNPEEAKAYLGKALAIEPRDLKVKDALMNLE